MFRRKEDSLFDNATDTQTMSSETTTVATAPSATSTASSASASAPAASTTTSAPAPTSSRPAPETRSGFRSSSALGSEITRNRMPEAKNAAAATVTTDKSGKGARRVLTVGNDILLKGEIATCDRLVIEGKVDATLNEVHTVEIAETGSFKGSAHIEDAEISGLFEGDLIVRGRLVIYATGKVRGKISYGEIEIERGGELTGEIKATSNQSSASSNTRPARPTAKEDKFAA
jgi:cytoskeletal protein CcmA (bactofilin family)